MAVETEQVNNELIAGDKFETIYPFKLVDSSYQNYDGDLIGSEQWVGGCHIDHEPSDCGYGEQPFYRADANGKRILEVLSVAEMPGNWQKRIIYSCHMIDPDGHLRKGRKAYTVTEAIFLKMSKGYFTDYDVEDAE